METLKDGGDLSVLTMPSNECWKFLSETARNASRMNCSESMDIRAPSIITTNIHNNFKFMKHISFSSILL
jgi:hypothetical protein